MLYGLILACMAAYPAIWPRKHAPLLVMRSQSADSRRHIVAAPFISGLLEPIPRALIQQTSNLYLASLTFRDNVPYSP